MQIVTYSVWFAVPTWTRYCFAYILSMGRRLHFNRFPRKLVRIKSWGTSFWVVSLPLPVPTPPPKFLSLKGANPETDWILYLRRQIILKGQALGTARNKQNHCSPRLPEWELLALRFGRSTAQKLSKQSLRHRGGCRSGPHQKISRVVLKVGQWQGVLLAEVALRLCFQNRR